MRIITLATIAALAAAPALAQPAPRHASGAHHAKPRAHPRTPPRTRPSAESPLDRGPFTPEANRAYQGGGVILQGAPGAPAPMPEATPPGQAPRNAVPPR
jgi:hypothetical protein